MVTDQDMKVTGNPAPDCRGDYNEAGMHNGQPYYTRLDGAYKIWKTVLPFWNISTDLDVEAPGYWRNSGPAIEDDYAPNGTYAGTATVTAM